MRYTMCGENFLGQNSDYVHFGLGEHNVVDSLVVTWRSGITNTYYYGRLHKQQPDLKVKPFWPNQDDRGVHVNLAGAGVTQHAPHAEQARKLLEWMTTPEAQGIFAGVNQEYPANPAVEPSAEVASWGTFKADSVATGNWI